MQFSGNLTGRRVTISVTGRATYGRQRDIELWLPATDGTLSEYVLGLEQRVEGKRPRLRIA